MKKNQEYYDACIFCLSKCPECKSTNVKVSWSMDYEYENDVEDLITIGSYFVDIEMDCLECDKIFSWDDNRLDKLETALEKIMPKLKAVSEDGGVTLHIDGMWTRVTT